MTIYAKLLGVTTPEQIDCDGSDLLVKKTKTVVMVLRGYKHKDYVTQFRHVKDNCMWLRVPCAYDPWWYAQGAKPIER